MSHEEKTLLKASLVYPLLGDAVLMGWKLRKIGADNWNGFGGGPKGSETMVRCALRELAEESGIRALPRDLEKAAIVHFHNTKSDGSTFTCVVHVYIAKNWRGKPLPGKEMASPTLFPADRLPKRMLPADHIFLPLILSGKKLVAHFYYGPHQKKLTAPPRLRYVRRVPER